MSKRDYLNDMSEYINLLERAGITYTRQQWYDIIDNEMKDNGLETNGIEIGWILDKLDLDGYVIFESND